MKRKKIPKYLFLALPFLTFVPTLAASCGQSTTANASPEVKLEDLEQTISKKKNSELSKIWFYQLEIAKEKPLTDFQDVKSKLGVRIFVPEEVKFKAWKHKSDYAIAYSLTKGNVTKEFEVEITEFGENSEAEKSLQSVVDSLEKGKLGTKEGEYFFSLMDIPEQDQTYLSDLTTKLNFTIPLNIASNKDSIIRSDEIDENTGIPKDGRWIYIKAYKEKFSKEISFVINAEAKEKGENGIDLIKHYDINFKKEISTFWNTNVPKDYEDDARGFLGKYSLMKNVLRLGVTNSNLSAFDYFKKEIKSDEKLSLNDAADAAKLGLVLPEEVKKAQNYYQVKILVSKDANAEDLTLTISPADSTDITQATTMTLRNVVGKSATRTVLDGNDGKALLIDGNEIYAAGANGAFDKIKSDGTRLAEFKAPVLLPNFIKKTDPYNYVPYDGINNLFMDDEKNIWVTGQQTIDADHPAQALLVDKNGKVLKTVNTDMPNMITVTDFNGGFYTLYSHLFGQSKSHYYKHQWSHYIKDKDQLQTWDNYLTPNNHLDNDHPLDFDDDTTGKSAGGENQGKYYYYGSMVSAFPLSKDDGYIVTSLRGRLVHYNKDFNLDETTRPEVSSQLFGAASYGKRKIYSVSKRADGSIWATGAAYDKNRPSGFRYFGAVNLVDSSMATVPTNGNYAFPETQRTTYLYNADTQTFSENPSSIYLYGIVDDGDKGAYIFGSFGFFGHVQLDVVTNDIVLDWSMTLLNGRRIAKVQKDSEGNIYLLGDQGMMQKISVGVSPDANNDVWKAVTKKTT